MEYSPSYEVITVLITAPEFDYSKTFWISLEDVKKAYIASSEIGTIRFLEKSTSKVIAL